MDGERNISEEIARTLEEELSNFKGPYLPPMRSLVERYSVSLSTIRLAVKLLVNKGVLLQKPKCRPIKASFKGGLPQETQTYSSFEFLLKEFHGKIEGGNFAYGELLPKISYVSKLYHMSNHTVARVYTTLCREGLAHRSGKMVAAGKMGPERIAFGPSPGVIVILTSHPKQWKDLCVSLRTAAFGREFLSLAARDGHRMVLAVTDTGSKLSIRGPAGYPTLRTYIRRLGTKFLGTLVITDVFENPGDLRNWVDLLGEFEKPIVWFDRRGKTNIKSRPSSNFYRCYFDEMRAARVAVEFLHSKGHRDVHYLLTQDKGWQKERFRYMEEHGRKLGPPVNVFAIETLYPMPLAVMVEQLEQLECRPRQTAKTFLGFLGSNADYIRSEAGPSPYGKSDRIDAFLSYYRAADEIKERLGPEIGKAAAGVSSALGLYQTLSQPKVTAVVAPSDRIADSFHLKWLRQLDVRVPEDISFLSFDNIQGYWERPFSSVDMGFGELGYRAYHLINGTLHVQTDSVGNIANSPYVVDFGSVDDISGSL